MTTSELISELTYSCYRYNRDRSPEITPEGWARVFPTGPELERRYQEDTCAQEAARTRDTMHEDAQRRKE